MFFFILGCLACFTLGMMLWCSPSYRVQRWLKKTNRLDVYHTFNTLYQGMDATSVAVLERERLGMMSCELIYGEIDFLSFAAILDMIRPGPEDIFYDLGSGAGKAVIATTLLFPVKKACGIELLPGLHALSLSVARDNPRIEFIQADYLTIDISEATIVFINATGLFGKSWEAMCTQLATLKRDTWIILTSKQLPPAGFTLMNQARRMMSWGSARVSIYRVL